MADWTCPECVAFTICGIDAPGHEETSRTMIADHQAIHRHQLAEMDGDADALRLRLQNPSLHAALITDEGTQQ